jgi:ATP-dependent Zn protease
MKEVIVQQKLTLLEHLDKILEFSEEKGLDETFFEKAKQHIDAAAGELKVSPIQAVLFAFIFDISVLGVGCSSKEELLVELEEKKPLNKSGFIMAADIAEKSLFYTAEEEEKISRLEELLNPDNFKTVTDRLGDKGLRKGFACLFSGGPGTGKTETVYQIARRTGRDIMPVDVSKIKSCWVGQSEQNIRAQFDGYRRHVKDAEIAPILFFNEADAIMGQRREFHGSSRAVDQMENSIQNIILEELEMLEGILIATTNLAGNFDRAFERRFIYKIEFQKPSLEARKSIWKSLIPELQDREAETLAGRFIFSGGQIENIARKRTVEAVLSGTAPSLDTLIAYCRDESLEKEAANIGFTL